MQKLGHKSGAKTAQLRLDDGRAEFRAGVWGLSMKTLLDHKSAKLALPIAACLLFAACAPGSEDSAHAASSGLLGEFLLGLWHGIISPITLLAEIVNALLPRLLPWHAHLYEVKAAGPVYDLGFYLGLGGGPVVIWRRGRRL